MIKKKYEYKLGPYKSEYRSTIINLLDEFQMDYKEEWKSKYNSYIVCDCEPFCTDSFDYIININSTFEVVSFVEYLIFQHIEKVNKLYKCLKKTNKGGN